MKSHCTGVYVGVCVGGCKDGCDVCVCAYLHSHVHMCEYVFVYRCT